MATLVAFYHSGKKQKQPRKVWSLLSEMVSENEDKWRDLESRRHILGTFLLVVQFLPDVIHWRDSNSFFCGSLVSFDKRSKDKVEKKFNLS